MRILSFDASSQAIHLCLMEDGKIIVERIIESENPARQELASNLLPAIAAAFTQAQWDKASLGMVVVGQGPGSFTGIRGAVVVARTFAYALKLPLMGFNRFEVIASYFEGPATVVLPGYRDLCYVAILELTPAGPTSYTMKPSCMAMSELPPNIKPDTLPLIANLASRQAEIAWNRLSLKTNDLDKVTASDFPWKLVEPLYLREPSVTVKKS